MNDAQKMPRWGLALLGLLLLLVLVLKISTLRCNYWMIDELITMRVVDRVLGIGTLDVNWDLIDWGHPSLSKLFKYPQYNFYGYLLAASGATWIQNHLPGLSSIDLLIKLRLLSFGLAMLVPALTFWVSRRLFDWKISVLAALVVAAMPLLFQDGLYARPEPFVTVLTLLFVGILSLQVWPAMGRLALASFILGVLVATKVSMLALVPLFFLPWLVPLSGQPLSQAWVSLRADLLRPPWREALVVLVCAFVGFALAAPYALVHAGIYLHGLAALNTQYTTGQWPFGLDDANAWERLQFSMAYFRSTMGLPALALYMLGGLLAVARRQYSVALMFLVTLVVLIRFCTYPTFFERNVSHVMPLLGMLVSWAIFVLVRSVGRSHRSRLALVVISTVGVLWTPVQTIYKLRVHELSGAQTRKLDAMRASLERTSGQKVTQIEWTRRYEQMKVRIDAGCGPALVEIPYPGDRDSIHAIQQLVRQDGFHEVARLRSTFEGTPTSTLHTYFTPTTIFLLRPNALPNCLAAAG